jgi:hypothetical protein
VAAADDDDVVLHAESLLKPAAEAGSFRLLAYNRIGNLLNPKI